MSKRDEDRVFSSLAAGLKQQPTDTAVKDRVLEKVAGVIDLPPAGGTTVRDTETDWKQITDTVSVKVLLADESQNTQTAIWKLEPGGRIPGHSHAMNEECLVLEGEFHVGNHILHAGDFHVMSAGSDHPELKSPDGCLLYIRQAITRDLSWMAE